MILIHGPSFAEQSPGVPECRAGRPTPELRRYVNDCIAASDRRRAAHDAAPDEETAEDDIDPSTFFNGVTYKEGLRRYEEHQRKTGLLDRRAVMRDEAEPPIGDLLRDALRGMKLLQ